uniref:Ubiquitin-like modifier-activating enzyme ATG7 n=1 Tax=Steinernema glaseri TaxID=37863 RepID=A0A1I8AUY0_9BILA
MTKVTFAPFVTTAHSAFWDALNQRKLTEWKLDESPRCVWAQAAQYKASQKQTSQLQLDHSSFFAPPADQIRAGVLNIPGSLIVYNTAESFGSADRKALLASKAEAIWSAVRSGEWSKNPCILNSFVLTVFADLKKMVYFYWNCVPALIYPDNVEVAEKFEPSQDKQLTDLVHSTFLNNGNAPFLLVDGNAVPISEITSVQNPTLVYMDYSGGDQLSWNLRNLLAAVAYARKDLSSLNIVASRGANGILRGKISWTIPGSEGQPTAVGWERDESGQLRCKKTVLPKVDQAARADQMIDLNLKLISWRLVPDIKLENFTDARCLLLGSGTLGCNMARALLGWGLKNFTFVDNSTVSLSNPVRQSLFTFKDAQEGKSKAEAAAENLRNIRPTVNAKGVNMMIPMPGHPVSPAEESKTHETVNQLEQLIKDHDVVFLLLDSREARWLPTVLASVHNKLCFTVGLGFNSFVAMRHGGEPSGSIEDPVQDLSLSIPGSELACYFCCDVTAPTNSMRDRTLDQQCTVTRPGACFWATSMATELFASVVQHPLGIDAPADIAQPDDNATVLGATPHQIRGYLNSFKQMTPAVRRNTNCTACGNDVRRNYVQEGWNFLLKVFNDPSYLEQVTGLDQLHIAAEDVNDQIIAYDDDESV